ncbi:PTS system N-acetylglucosamine-specific IIC component [Sediminihabitans luteus]|uniref:PTS system N-acetylglucosamine-specific IIC component n=1 Tax=Sediminihabitans luteus TaxID=1138585 RepID=A0A2M9CY21_9CELL|nr:PTS transporter subunit EIIC [Sediminihabitans luteus]PJJ76831.1 PTS system N-acetylglucosamine-specific IIC component [Sediminihabitans luteus]GIJ00310.1 PTS glucose transporter subunit IIBC [Sediminihabitans luteus]
MTATAVETPRKGIPGFAQLQRIGRSLMLPIASLPAAALLLRLGQADMLGADGAAKHLPWMQPVADVLGAAGNALFANLAMLFAVGVAVGFAKKSDGSTALAAVIGYFVFTGVTDALSPRVLGTAAEGETQELINYGVLGGIVIGLTAAILFQKYSRIKLPPYLAFFGGRRFVPIVTAGAAVVLAVLGALIYPGFDWLINEKIGGWVTGSTILGAFVFGTLNRLLVPIGLHHLLNSLPWFQFGSYTDANGETWNGDIARFLHQDPTAGTFLTGFFPIMMFALPAAALAIIHTAKPENRKVIAGVMGSAALVSIVTGVTEPLEFSFVFVAYPLYVIHAVLTGTSLALVNALGIRDGFGFSAGAIDYLLNFRIAEMPLLLIPIGLGYAVIYYFLFRWVITKWNLKTPGREDDPAAVGADPTADQPDAAPVRKEAAVESSSTSVESGGSSTGDAPTSDAPTSDTPQDGSPGYGERA